jgi:hypothetical protein
MKKVKEEFEIGEEWKKNPNIKEQSHTFLILGRDIKIVRANGERYFEVSQSNYARQLQEMAIPEGVKMDAQLPECSLFRACVGRINWL